MQWILWASLILGPLAYVGDRFGWPNLVVLILATAGIIPPSVLLGRATEQIAAAISGPAAERVRPGNLGAKIGALLNATFGNAPDLIITTLALQAGLVALTKAAIIGAILANAGVGLGLAMFLGGARNGLQRFDAGEAGHQAVLLAIAVSSLALPAMFLVSSGATVKGEESVVTAAVLLGSYVAYLLYSIFGLGRPEPEATADQTPVQTKARVVPELKGRHEHWPLRQGIAVLALATVIVYFASEALVSSIEPFAIRFGWSQVFIGLVLLPLVGSIPQNSSASLLAIRNKMDVALGVSVGAAIQGAIFVAPLLVFISRLTHHLDLLFEPIEIAALVAVVAIFFLVARDGKSSWFEGLQLLALYALIGTVAFFVHS